MTELGLSPDHAARTSTERATGRVLSSMLDETMDLMAEVSALGDRRAAELNASPHEVAATLRAATRLARVGGWVLSQNADREAAAAARAALDGARANHLDPIAPVGPLADVQTRIDRLAERALRLDALMAGDAPESPDRRMAPLEPEVAADVLPLRRPQPAE